MKDNEQSARIHKGVAEWNAWRKTHRNVAIDLTEANLREANLRGANLARATLIGSDLTRAALAGADLRRANLTFATLTGTVFIEEYMRGRNLDTGGITAAKLSHAILKQQHLAHRDLSGVDLRGADLTGANLHGANLSSANLRGANLTGADLSAARLDYADLTGANCTNTNLSGQDLTGRTLKLESLSGANLSSANLTGADLRSANLAGANLQYATLVQTRLEKADLSGCVIYGISAWNVRLAGAYQTNLRITPPEEPEITADNLEVAQFLYLLLHNQKVRAVLDTITSKVVLILGRFSDKRKPVLDGLREALRCHPNSYIPVLFDFEKQRSKPVLETVKTLANLARFVVADLTDPMMVRSEVTYITANVPAVPVQPLVEGGAKLPTEYESWALFQSFLPVFRYTDLAHLLANLNDAVVAPVEQHVRARRIADPI